MVALSHITRNAQSAPFPVPISGALKAPQVLTVATTPASVATANLQLMTSDLQADREALLMSMAPRPNPPECALQGFYPFLHLQHEADGWTKQGEESFSSSNWLKQY